MTSSRKPLDFGSLDDFDTPKSGGIEKEVFAPIAEKKAVDRVSAFPSRERLDDSQLNIKAPEEVARRFRAMAKAERYTHGAFLEILMDAYDGKK
ncbi:hypothetical protein [Frigidibacter mobilis]|nr:hypothetical protein [Frigidibacter mobilis]